MFSKLRHPSAGWSSFFVVVAWRCCLSLFFHMYYRCCHLQLCCRIHSFVSVSPHPFLSLSQNGVIFYWYTSARTHGHQEVFEVNFESYGWSIGRWDWLPAWKTNCHSLMATIPTDLYTTDTYIHSLAQKLRWDDKTICFDMLTIVTCVSVFPSFSCDERNSILFLFIYYLFKSVGCSWFYVFLLNFLRRVMGCQCWLLMVLELLPKNHMHFNVIMSSCMLIIEMCLCEYLWVRVDGWAQLKLAYTSILRSLTPSHLFPAGNCYSRSDQFVWSNTLNEFPMIKK